MSKHESRTIDLGPRGTVTIAFELLTADEFAVRFPHLGEGCRTPLGEFLAKTDFFKFINPLTARFEPVPRQAILEAFRDADLDKPFSQFSCSYRPHPDGPRLYRADVEKARREAGLPPLPDLDEGEAACLPGN